jgi:hypothetical protein
MYKNEIRIGIDYGLIHGELLVSVISVNVSGWLLFRAKKYA